MMAMQSGPAHKFVYICYIICIFSLLYKQHLQTAPQSQSVSTVLYSITYITVVYIQYFLYPLQEHGLRHLYKQFVSTV